MSERMQPRREIILLRTIHAGTLQAFEALLPDELDLAITNNEIGRLESDLENIRTQEQPPNIAAYRERLAGGDEFKADGAAAEGEGRPRKRASRAPRPEDDLARDAILDYERAEAFRWQQRQMQLSTARARQERQLALLKDPKYGVPEGVEVAITEKVFLVRAFSYDELLEIEDETSELDTRSRERRIRTGERNIELLRRCLIGEVVQTTDGEEVTKAISDAGGDHQSYMRVLIDRQWSRVQMSEELQSYFRGRSNGDGDRGARRPRTKGAA